MRKSPSFVTKLLAPLLATALAFGAAGCADTSDDAPAANPTLEDDQPSGPFVSEPEDEAIDPADPPTDPDPADDDDDGVEMGAGSVAPQGGAQASRRPATCKERKKTLSPKGMTFVLHISKFGDQANAALEHLKKVQSYIRPRDIFMVERSSQINARLRALFPCNKIHFIAFPEELDTAFESGSLIDGIAVDWEGDHVDGNSQAYSIDKLRSYSRQIRSRGFQAGFVPSWKPRFSDPEVMRASNMDYDLAQIQPACPNSASAYGHRTRDMLREFRRHEMSLRNVGFEISMNSFDIARHNVGPARAADCTRKAYGKGARAIYIYGNGQDHFVDYFHALGRMGVRRPR